MIEKREQRFHCGLISKNRNVLFGISMVMIILFHFGEDYHAAVSADKIANVPLWGEIVLHYYRYVRSIGVELFVFMAGMGQYYSFCKSPEVLGYYKRRVSRVLIPYALLAVPFWFFKDAILSSAGVAGFFKDLLFFTFFTDAEHALWFIGFILAMYLILPLIYRLFHETGKAGGMFFVGLMVLTIALSNAYRLSHPDAYLRVEIALTRIPIFFVGVYAGKWIKEDRGLWTPGVAVFTIVSIGLKIYLTYTETKNYIVRYTDILYALALIVLLTLLSEFISRQAQLKQFFVLVGAYSLELYMTHVTVRGIFKELDIHTWHIRCYVGVIFLAILLSAGIKKITVAQREKQYS
ncbi:MAG: acyltransferase [Lachnospiraceae bacterium]|nr:acyltransferase [Lachnospiraceae bacterium]